LVDHAEFDLPQDWAEYTSQEDEDRWKEADDKIQEVFDTHGQPTVPKWWYDKIRVRFDNDEEFAMVWKGKCRDPYI